jgi:hypothetical protein
MPGRRRGQNERSRVHPELTITAVPVPMNRLNPMAKYPRDQFDDIPVDLARVGAHRAPVKPGRGWITFAWAALFTGIFVVGGLAGLNFLRGQSFLGEAPTNTISASVEVTAEPILDPSLIAPERAITITVLNGTTTVDLENVAATQLAGWPIAAALVASDRTEEKTVIYYSDPANEDVARGLVIALGVGEVRESSAYLGAPVTIVLGADYTPPPSA